MGTMGRFTTRRGEANGLLRRPNIVSSRLPKEQAANENQNRILFELNSNPMWIFDESTLQFLAVNEATVRLYNWSREEFLRMTVKDVRPAGRQI